MEPTGLYIGEGNRDTKMRSHENAQSFYTSVPILFLMSVLIGATAISLMYPSRSFAARRNTTTVENVYASTIGMKSRSKFPGLAYHGELKGVGTDSAKSNLPKITASGLNLAAGSTFWTSTNGPLGGNVYSIAADDSIGYIYAGTDSGVFRSTDNGGSWTRVASGLPVHAVAVGSNGFIYAGTYDGIYLSTDSGGSWNPTTMTYQTMSFTVAPSGAILAGTASDGIFASTDSGTNWTQISTSTAVEVYALAVNSSGYIFAGTYDASNPGFEGVYRSTDGGQTWGQVGLANTWVWTLATNSSGDEVFAGTYGNGVYLSTDGGNTWAQEDSGLTNTLIYSLAVNSSGDVFAGSDGNGVYESTDNGGGWTATGPTDRTFWALAVSPSGYVFAGADSGGVYRTTYATSIGTLPVVPTLASPANGSTGIATNPKLHWYASPGAASYGLQVFNDTTIVTDIAGLSFPMDSLSGLSPLTTYYWRVNASDSAGTSAWSSFWRFTTGSPQSIPAVPILISPVNGATGLPTNLRLTWGSSAGATSYRLQVSTDSTFTPTVTDTAGLSSSTDSLSGLFALTTYYWRVNAIFAGGNGAWSSVWHFTTVGENRLSQPAPVSPSNGSTGMLTYPILSWNAVSGATFYQLQVSIDTTFSTVLFQNRDLRTTSLEVSPLSEGTTYYWRVRAGDANDSSAWSSTWSFKTFTYPSSISVSMQFTFGTSLDSTNYQIIGLPGDIDTLIGSLVIGRQGKDWDAYWDNGDSLNYYLGYDSSQTFDFKPGRAFWILSKNPFQISQNVAAVPLDTNDSYLIALHGGWNLISDPFDKNVTWSSVQAVNGTSQPIWAFSNGSYSQPSAMVPYEGYYFYNNVGLSHLRIPYVYSPGVVSASSLAGVMDGNITVALKENTGGIGSITVGLREACEVPPDIFAPPGNFERASIFIVDSTISSAWKDLVQDLRDSIRAGQTFDFRVINKTGKKLDLDFHVGSGLSGYQICLVDNDLLQSYNLKETDHVSIPPYDKVTRYSILIGSNSFIDRRLSELVPQGFVLYQNYPNPFNPVTVIRFEIPFTERVMVTVYDILGRRVETLMDSKLSPGYYEVQFNGNRYASGVYFYRISAGTFSQVKKMVLLK